MADRRIICLKKETAEGYIDFAINILRSQGKIKNFAVIRIGKKSKFNQSTLLTLKSLVTGFTVIVIGSIYLSLIIWMTLMMTRNLSNDKFVNSILFYLPVLIPLTALIIGIVVFCKKVKSKRLIIASAIILFFTLMYSSIFAMMPTLSISPVKPQSFVSEMEENNFSIDDITTSRTENYLEKCYVATSPTGDYEIYCLEFDSSPSYGLTYATDFYSKTQREYIINEHFYSSNNYQVNSYRKFFIGENSDKYFIIYIYDTTVIYTCSDSEYKEEIKDSLSNYISFGD